MAAKKLAPEERVRLAGQVIELREKGRTERKIAAELSIPYELVGTLIDEYIDAQKKRRTNLVDAERAVVVSFLDQVLESILPQARGEIDAQAVADAEVTEDDIKAAGGDENLAKLRKARKSAERKQLWAFDRVISAIERKAKLQGLDAPTKVAPTDPSGEQQYDAGAAEVDGLLARLAASIEAAGDPSLALPEGEGAAQVCVEVLGEAQPDSAAG